MAISSVVCVTIWADFFAMGSPLDDVNTPSVMSSSMAVLISASAIPSLTSFIEIVSTCSSGWKKDPVKANKWMEENMFPYYPIGDLKDI